METVKNPLFQIIASEIQNYGPISIERYMELCLYHPQYGYYKTKDPLGHQGDFTTSPEISGIFGESLGLFMGRILIN